MPRDLVVGNGTILVNLDKNLNIRDLHYPHVGLSNHVNGHVNRIGVWADGQFAWIGNTWSVNLKYLSGTLITDCYASNGRLGITLRFNDTVHPEHNLILRRVSVQNLLTTEREIRLFFHHDFRIHETDIGDTVFFHPQTSSMIHFKRDCYFLMNGRTSKEGIFEYAAGVKEFGGQEGTWRDAEDGSLGKNPIEQGSVDSTICFRVFVPGGKTEVIDFWIAAGRSLQDVETLNEKVCCTFTDDLFDQIRDHHTAHLAKGVALHDELSIVSSGRLAKLYEQSLLTLRTQIDRSGGILAANDTDIMQTARAHYSYVWPRDGALVANALDLAGYAEPSKRFLSFCASILPHDSPYFLQKYNPDRTLGATWHPWIINGRPEIPCQQDSTALVIWAAGKHYERWKDKEFMETCFHDLVTPAVDYMVKSLDPITRLPKPSYDLWEQWRGVHLFTCCAVYGAFSAAAKLAKAFKDFEREEKYKVARNDLRQAILSSFYDQRLCRFIRSLKPDHDDKTVNLIDSSGGAKSLKPINPDLAIDVSMAGIFLFDLLPADDQRVISTMEAIYDRLWVRTPVGGLARYEDDYYFQVSSDVQNVPGNPWFVATMWMAEWYIAVANNIRDLEPALDLLRWAVRYQSEAGLMAEQIHPFTGQPLSVMPLTWSHAAYVSAVMKYQTKVLKLKSRKKADRK